MAICGELKQSTTVTISLGPFIDKDDGDTEKTGLTIQDTDVYLSKNGAAKAVPNDTNNCTEDANGVYRKQLNATDTGTLGILTVYVHFTDCLYIRQDYLVLRADIYDSKYGSDYQQVDIVQIGGDTQSGTDLKDFADAGYDPVTNKVEGVKLVDTSTANSDMRGTDNAALAATALSTADWTAARAGYLDNLNIGENVAGTSEIAALPTAVENRTEMDNNSTRLANLDQSLSTTESNIRGADSDDLKDISDEIGALNNFDNTSDQVIVATNNDKTDYGLANDAITAAKYDESTAFPLKSDDSGLTEVARTGADGDTLEDISDEIAALNNLSAADVQNECEDAIDVKFSFTGANVNSDNQDKAGYSLSAAGIDSILDEVVEGTLTMRHILRILLSALANKTTGGGTNNLTSRNLADSKARITITLDANKNRTTSVVDGT
jgi:hypothetical protein